MRKKSNDLHVCRPCMCMYICTRMYVHDVYVHTSIYANFIHIVPPFIIIPSSQHYPYYVHCVYHCCFTISSLIDCCLLIHLIGSHHNKCTIIIQWFVTIVVVFFFFFFSYPPCETDRRGTKPAPGTIERHRSRSNYPYNTPSELETKID